MPQLNFSCHFSKYTFLSSQENWFLCSGEGGKIVTLDSSTSPPLASLAEFVHRFKNELVYTTCHPSQAAGVLQEGPRTIKHHPCRGNCTLQCCIKNCCCKTGNKKRTLAHGHRSEDHWYSAWLQDRELQAVKIFLLSSKLIYWERWYRGNSHSGTINIEPIYTRNMPLCKLYRQKTEDGNQSK